MTPACPLPAQAALADESVSVTHLFETPSPPPTRGTVVMTELVGNYFGDGDGGSDLLLEANEMRLPHT